MSEIKLHISEIFHSLQGEGVLCGTPSVFLRLAGCNLNCLWKRENGTLARCDTPQASYRMDDSQVLHELPVAVAWNIDSLCRTRKTRHLVITGGEPTIQDAGVKELIKHLQEQLIITVETNGTNIVKWPFVDVWSVSPKLSLCGRKVKDNDVVVSVVNLRLANPDSIMFIKFVAASEEHCMRIKEFRNILKRVYSGSVNDIGIMPEGRTREQLEASSKLVVDFCLEEGFRFVDRLHIKLWNGEKGK
jgi:7-carboxy-7-deazaguanine synthase